MESPMNNGNLKIVKNTQTSADNAGMGKTAFSLVQDVIIEAPIGVFSFCCWGKLRAIPRLKNFGIQAF